MRSCLALSAKIGIIEKNTEYGMTIVRLSSLPTLIEELKGRLTQSKNEFSIRSLKTGLVVHIFILQIPCLSPGCLDNVNNVIAGRPLNKWLLNGS